MAEEERKSKGLTDLAKQVTEEELTQRRKSAINPIPQSTYMPPHVCFDERAVYVCGVCVCVCVCVCVYVCVCVLTTART